MEATKAESLETGPQSTVGNKDLIPLLDLKAQFTSIRDDVLKSVTRVIESQQFILGPEVSAFESEMAQTLGAKFAISCASGSDALLLTLMAYGIGSGDEVITTPFTFVATAGSIARLGARPVFVDINPATYNIDPFGIEEAITPRTRAIVPVHLFGQPADMAPILDIAARRGVLVIEDAAQAIGARYHGAPVGTIAQVGCFSFFPSKNLGGAGDGGMLVTNIPEIAGRLLLLRSHGSRSKYHHEVLGMNSRLDALQAAILGVKLAHLPAWSQARQRNADRYRFFFAERGLADSVGLPAVEAGCEHVYNQFVIRVRDRDRLKSALQQRGIATEVYYPSPLHLQPAFSYLGHHAGDFPVAEAASAEVLALPIYPELVETQQRRVVEEVAAFLRGNGRPVRSEHA